MTGIVDPKVLARARKIWDEREQAFPAFTRLTWEQGMAFARMETLAQAKRELAAGRTERG